MFVKCPRIIAAVTPPAAKTIIYENFNPNGQAFSTSFEKTDFDLRSTDTFFANINIKGTSKDRRELLAIGDNISKATDGSATPTIANTSLIELRYYQNTIQVRDGTYKGWWKASAFNGKTFDTFPNDFKIAFNLNGVAICGVDTTSSFAPHTTVVWADILNNFYSANATGIQIGSVYAKTGTVAHSNQLINEVSIIHDFLSLDEMITLTS